jgi:predicted Zn-dependent protease with MMP-like domain
VRADDFDRIVEEAYARIPAQFRRRLQNVAIVVEAEPGPEHQRHGGVLLGLYEGRPLTNRSVLDSFVMPDRITIFQGPHERLARNPAHLRELVWETVWHEIAHYFGMNERQVRMAEARRKVPRGPASKPQR